MESNNSFLDSPALPLIISKLKDPEDVYRCMRVCRKLDRVIKRNYRIMSKYTVDISFDFTSYPDILLRVSHSDVFVRKFLYLIDFLTEGLGVYRFRSEGNLTSGPFEACRQRWITPNRSNSFAICEYIDGTNVLSCFKEMMFFLMVQFDIGMFTCASCELPEVILKLLIDSVKSTGVKASSCYIGTPLHWELPYILNCKRVEVIPRADLLPQDLLLLRTKSADINVRYNANVTIRLALVKQFLMQWERGTRDIQSLRLATTAAPKGDEPGDDVCDMMQMLRASNYNVNSTLQRGFDGAALNFTYTLEKTFATYSIVNSRVTRLKQFV